MKKIFSAIAVALISLATLVPVYAQTTTSDAPRAVYDNTPFDELEPGLICPDGSPAWQTQHQIFLDAWEGLTFAGKFDLPEGGFVVLYDVTKIAEYEEGKPEFLAFGFDSVGCWIGIIFEMTAAEASAVFDYVQVNT